MSKKDTILVISALFPPEPVVSAMLSRDIAERLSLQHKVMVLCPKPTRPQGYQFPEVLENDTTPYEVIHQLSFTSPESNVIGRLKESKSFGKHCDAYIDMHHNEISCVYANSWPLFAQKKIVKTAAKYKIPCILHIQDIYPESIAKKMPSLFSWMVNSLYLSMDRYILNGATHIIGISQPMISYLSSTRNIPLTKFTLIRNWQNDADYKYNSHGQNKEENFVFMYVGSIAPSAGVDNVIRAYHKIAGAKTKLIIAGSGAEKEKCVQLSKALDIHSVEFIDVSPDEVAQLQSKADTLILPLKKGIAKTATPSKLTAYLLSAKPVIACVETDTDVADIISKASCGFIVEPEEIGRLSESMTQLMKMDNTVLIQMGVNARKFALRELSREVNLSKLVSLVQKYAKWK